MKHTKLCRACLQELPLDSFYKSTSRTRDGFRHECKACWNKESMEYHRTNREEILEKRKEYHYQKSYGISRDEFLSMVEEQGGKCPVCSREDLVLDHCHDTGRVRGVLCNKCNQAIGNMLDNPALIRSLADWLETH